MKMKSRQVLLALIALIVSASCADTGGNAKPRPQITSCPPGFVLICESRQPPSKGGPY